MESDPSVAPVCFDLEIDPAQVEIVIGALIAETARLGDAIAERLAAAERFVAVAGALSGIGLTLGLFQQQKQILIGLPLVVGIIFLFMIQIYTDAGMHSGHRRALEERLARVFKRPILVGQSYVAVGYARRASIPMTFGLAILAWLGTVALGAIATNDLVTGSKETALAFIAYSGVILFLVIAMVFAMTENARAEETARLRAATALGQDPVIDASA